MRSLRTRLTLIVAGLALVAVATVTIIVAITTNEALEETLAEQRAAREVIVGELNELALELDKWEEAEELVEALAREFQARIVLTDIDGFRLLDTDEGPLPPLEGVIDPFGPLAEFNDEIPFDTDVYNAVLVECLEAEGIPFLIDEFGEVFLLEAGLSDDAFEVIEGCFEEAIIAVEKDPSGVKEAALLFISFDTSPAIPWVLVALIAAGVIAGAAVLAAPISGLVTRSLRTLAGAARAIRAGNLDVRVEARSPTEVADLASSFNDMAEELARAEVRRKQLTADVAHELRSPLTNILGHLDAIEDGVIEPSPDQVRIITAEAARVAHLVDDLQTLSALDEDTLALAKGPADICTLIDRSIEARQARAREREITVLRSGECNSPLSVDSTRIDQIVGNLLDNALEHTPNGGEVAVVVADTADAVHIRVTDSGPGIDPELLPRVFDRLSRADQVRSPGNGGRGLGLAIARGLARAHDGDITATNSAAGGARFEVTLPRSAD